MGDVVDVQIADGVARLTLQRPDNLNALSLELLSGLRDACDRIELDDDVRVAVITGSGRAFCVGADQDLLRRAFDPDDRAALHVFLDAINGTLARIEALDVPVIAAVNGLTRAGGFELLLACDLAIAADEARIGDVHTAFGMMPGGGSTHRLTRRVGRMRATEIIMSSRWLDGAEAAALGLVLRSVPGDQLSAAVDELSAGLVDKSRAVLSAVKQTMVRVEDLPTAAATAAERAAFLHYLDTAPGARERIWTALQPPA